MAQLDDEQRTLDSYGVREWMTIRVSENEISCSSGVGGVLTISIASQADSSDPNARALAGQYSDDSRVEKFELTKEEYEARNGEYSDCLLKQNVLILLCSPLA